MSIQKNVKSRVFWIFKKKRKKRILELYGPQPVGQRCCKYLVRWRLQVRVLKVFTEYF